MRWLPILLFTLPLAATAQQAPFDCSESATHRQFDFWLGDWEVRDSERRLALTGEMKARAVPVSAPHFEELGM